MGPSGFAEAEDPRGERRLLKPARHRLAEHTAAPLAAAGDDEHAALATILGSGQEGGERGVRRLLVVTVEVEPSRDRGATAFELTQGPAVEGRGAGRSGRWRTAGRDRARRRARRVGSLARGP